MKPLLAIMAHESAQPTVDDFLPRWNALGLDTICYVPEGDGIEGFADVRKIGKSAHAGKIVFERFTETMKDIAKEYVGNPERLVILIEYDTVPLRPVLPDSEPEAIVCCAMVDKPPKGHGWGDQLCLLSPWIMSVATIERLMPFADEAISELGDGEMFGGLLDRWFGHVVTEAGVPVRHGRSMLGHVQFHDVIATIHHHGLNWIHGWKSKDEFQHLWT